MQPGMWEALLEAHRDVADLAIGLLDRGTQRSLRLASKRLRAAVDRSAVVEVLISSQTDLAALAALRLQERFPQLARLVLVERDDAKPDSHPLSFWAWGHPPELRLFERSSPEPAGGSRQAVGSIDALAQHSLARLPALRALVLTGCAALPATGAARALALHCPWIQDLSLPRGGRPGPRRQCCLQAARAARARIAWTAA
jgi:hypothetical protein